MQENTSKIEKAQNIARMANDRVCKASAPNFLITTAPYKYSYNTSWLGCPIIHFPQDIVSMPELIWQIKPDPIIETDITHGGSLIFRASYGFTH